MKKIQIVLSAAALLFCIQAQAQDTRPSLAAFDVTVEKVSDGVKLYCASGCAWKELAFTVNNFQPQVLDNHGMVSMSEQGAMNEDMNSTFRFSLVKTEKGMELKGIQGTAWIDLTFTLKEGGQQAIDQNGMM